MRIQLLIGTRKGGFIATADGSRRHWSLQGPLLKGSEINHIAHVGNGRLVMAGKSGWWGPAVQISDDAGETWRDAGPIRFEEGRGHSVERTIARPIAQSITRLPDSLVSSVDVYVPWAYSPVAHRWPAPLNRSCR